MTATVPNSVTKLLTFACARNVGLVFFFACLLCSYFFFFFFFSIEKRRKARRRKKRERKKKRYQSIISYLETDTPGNYRINLQNPI